MHVSQLFGLEVLSEAASWLLVVTSWQPLGRLDGVLRKENAWAVVPLFYLRRYQLGLALGLVKTRGITPAQLPTEVS